MVRLQRGIGRGVLNAAPYIMKGLSVAGTAAMFLVGGGILTHGLPAANHWIEQVSEAMSPALQAPVSLALDAVVGILAGALVLAVVTGAHRLKKRFI